MLSKFLIFLQFFVVAHNNIIMTFCHKKRFENTRTFYEDFVFLARYFLF